MFSHYGWNSPRNMQRALFVKVVLTVSCSSLSVSSISWSCRSAVSLSILILLSSNLPCFTSSAVEFRFSLWLNIINIVMIIILTWRWVNDRLLARVDSDSLRSVRSLHSRENEQLWEFVIHQLIQRLSNAVRFLFCFFFLLLERHCDGVAFLSWRISHARRTWLGTSQKYLDLAWRSLFLSPRVVCSLFEALEAVKRHQ